MPELSIVIVTMKDEDDILCIPKFKREEFNDYEVIIRDDEGISKARNEGIKESDADKIVFIDDDAEPEKGYLQAATNILDDEYAVAGKVIHPGNGMVSKVLSHYPTGDEAQYTDSVVGCNMAFRKEVFETIGFFDENLLWGHDETELIQRVKKEYPVYYEPDMAVVHSYADGLLDYWNKQYQFGPADVYLKKRDGATDREIVRELLNPFWYFNFGLRTSFMRFTANLCRSAGRLRALRCDDYELD